MSSIISGGGGGGSGILELNGLTADPQSFAVGTTGTDFAISSATDTHTFNLPTASASNRGALSTADWTTFNSKQATVSFDTFGSTPNTDGGGISAGVITLQPADGSNPGGVSTTTQTFAGAKTFSSAPILSTLTASVPVVSDGSKALVSMTYATFTSNLSAATDSASGTVELAIASEVTTGTDTTRAITADALAGSDFGKRLIQLKVIDDSTTLTTGDGKLIFCIDAALNGYNLVAAQAFVSTVSSSGAPTVMIRNVTDAADMLSTAITIDASEFTSYTAATTSVVDGGADDVATGDLIAIDVDGAGTGAKGLGILLKFQLP